MQLYLFKLLDFDGKNICVAMQSSDVVYEMTNNNNSISTELIRMAPTVYLSQRKTARA